MVITISKKDNSETQISMKDQIKKFLNSLYGFDTIILLGLGRRLGIFNYLYEKSTSSPTSEKDKVVIFFPDELTKNLNLDANYLDAWLHLALECEIFETENVEEKSLKTCPYIYDLLINSSHPSYIGGTLGAFYYIAVYQDTMLKNFKTGEPMNLLQFPEEIARDLQERGKRFGMLIERLFLKKFETFCSDLTNQGRILDVGCGFGYNLETWAKQFQNTRFVGIDIDPLAVVKAKKLVEQNGWDERVNILETTVNKFTHATNKMFDLIILNQVLHEMDQDEKYRKQIFEDLYSLLKDDGILLVGENMITDTFAPRKKFQLFPISHKFFEAGSARFYDKQTFKDFIDSTPFTRAQYVEEKGTYFWAVQK
jgi:predicted O-methyltransferase YrrM